VHYLKRLIDDRVPVRVRLSDNQEVEGTIEFLRRQLIRLTRRGRAELISVQARTSSIFTKYNDTKLK